LKNEVLVHQQRLGSLIPDADQPFPRYSDAIIGVKSWSFFDVSASRFRTFERRVYVIRRVVRAISIGKVKDTTSHVGEIDTGEAIIFTQLAIDGNRDGKYEASSKT